MFCKNCGNKMNDSDSVCNSCGISISKNAAEINSINYKNKNEINSFCMIGFIFAVYSILNIIFSILAILLGMRGDLFSFSFVIIGINAVVFSLIGLMKIKQSPKKESSLLTFSWISICVSILLTLLHLYYYITIIYHLFKH